MPNITTPGITSMDKFIDQNRDQLYWSLQMRKIENYTSEDVNWLAKNIYFEARSENLHGQMAVAFVTLNRVATKRRWPHTIKGVVTQKWQFSWYNKGIVPPINNQKAYLKAKDVAILSLELYNDMCDADKFKYDGIVLGADHYFADYIPVPSWARNMEYKTSIGHHLFFRDS